MNNLRPPQPSDTFSIRHLQPALTTGYRHMNKLIAENAADFGVLQSEHLNRSRGLIAATALTAVCNAPERGPRRAVILGAGNCIDIPLEELTDMYDTTVLVDADPEAPTKAMDSLPAKQHNKVQFVAAELTGNAQNIATIIQSAKKQPTFDQYTHMFAKGLRKLTTDAAPDLGADYTFISSQLLLSQLHVIPLLHSDEVIARQYGKVVSPLPITRGETVYKEAGGQLARRMHATHIRHLSQLVSRTGYVHIADTYAQMVPVRGVQEPLHMVDPVKTEELIREHFEVLTDKAWFWNATPRTRFLVIANSLRPKHAGAAETV